MNDLLIKHAMGLLDTKARIEGVARNGPIRAERTRSGRVIWSINGNRCKRRDCISYFRNS